MMEIKKDWVIVNGNGDVVKVIYNETENNAEVAFAELVHYSDYDDIDEFELFEKEEWEEM